MNRHCAAHAQLLSCCNNRMLHFK